MLKSSKTPKHVIISGGNSGIGLGLAEIYLHRGAKVSILDLGLSDLARAKLNCAARSAGSQWQFWAADIANAQVVQQAVDNAVLQSGTPQLAINCAGIAIARPFATTTAEDFEKLIRVNLLGSHHFSSSVLPHLPSGGQLALMASMAGLVANYGYSAYGASKFGVVGLAQVLRCEYAAQDIAVSCICPPEIHTPMVEQERENGDPISGQLKQFAGSLRLHDALQQMVHGLDTGQAMIIPGRKARLAALACRIAPGLFSTATTLLVKWLRRKSALAPVQGH